MAANGSLTLKVASSSTAVKAYGMTFKRIRLEKQIILQGLNSLDGVLSFTSGSSSSSKSAVQRSPIHGFKIVDGHTTAGIAFQAVVELSNPAEITATLGDIRLKLQTDIDELNAGGVDQNGFIRRSRFAESVPLNQGLPRSRFTVMF